MKADSKLLTVDITSLLLPGYLHNIYTVRGLRIEALHVNFERMLTRMHAEPVQTGVEAYILKSSRCR